MLLAVSGSAQAGPALSAARGRGAAAAATGCGLPSWQAAWRPASFCQQQKKPHQLFSSTEQAQSACSVEEKFKASLQQVAERKQPDQPLAR
jgi:hypothetical protein